MRILSRRRTVLGASTILVMLVIIPSYLRLFVVVGESDAPAYVTGDRVLVNLAAYDFRMPYADRPLARLADPAPGDVVLCRLDSGQIAIKRVTAGPGKQVSLQRHHVVIDGVALEYATVQLRDEARLQRGQLGPVIQIERGNGPEVYISFDPDQAEPGGPTEFVVPQGSYFVLGSNRDASIDSRHFGALPRERILGRVIARL